MEHIFLHCSDTGVKNVEVLFVIFLSAYFCSPLMDGFGGGGCDNMIACVSVTTESKVSSSFCFRAICQRDLTAYLRRSTRPAPQSRPPPKPKSELLSHPQRDLETALLGPLRAGQAEASTTAASMQRGVWPSPLVPSLPRKVRPFCPLTCRAIRARGTALRTRTVSPKSSWNAGNALCRLSEI